jgi:hypothetical protein
VDEPEADVSVPLHSDSKRIALPRRDPSFPSRDFH